MRILVIEHLKRAFFSSEPRRRNIQLCICRVEKIVSVQADFVKQPDVFINDGTGTPFK
jgi:hypothetical protein